MKKQLKMCSIDIKYEKSRHGSTSSNIIFFIKNKGSELSFFNRIKNKSFIIFMKKLMCTIITEYIHNHSHLEP